MLCTRTILGLSSKRLNLCSLTSTKSLPTKTYVTSVGPIAAVRVKLSRLAAEYNQSYTSAMKTAISIPDAIFEEAERLAKIRGWSRSELYSNAVSAYVNSERFLGVREKLDAVYGHNVDDSLRNPATRCTIQPNRLRHPCARQQYRMHPSSELVDPGSAGLPPSFELRH